MQMHPVFLFPKMRIIEKGALQNLAFCSAPFFLCL